MKKRMKAAIAVFQVLSVITGVAVSLILNACGYIPDDDGNTQVYSIVVLAMLVLIVVIEIASALKIHDSTIHTVFTSCSLLISYVFSCDMQAVINPEQNVYLARGAEFAGFAAFMLIVLSHVYLVNFLYHSGISKIEGCLIAAYSAADCLLYLILMPYSAQYAAYIVYIPVIGYTLVKICSAMAKKRNCDLTGMLTFTIMCCALGMQTNELTFYSGGFAYPVYGITTTYFLAIVTLYAMVYACFLLRTERKALEASEYKLQAEKMRTKMLREQINPHFIFNSLITVKEAYHCDTERGDMAMNYFSRHLRANVEAMNTDCIPFSEELDNVENYIGLESMRRAKPVNIIYDVEYDAFMLPVLSLQVFVENAVRYARTEEKEDGFIAISSYKCTGGTAVEVTDNGVGFDVKSVNKNSCGIRNAMERFKLLLNADITIDSAKGKGTKVKIFIPDAGGGVKAVVEKKCTQQGKHTALIHLINIREGRGV
ncbi:MAG: histidine kinase [Clostridia bacterium]|nr:histidine kinase [Clostridia bacterium]